MSTSEWSIRAFHCKVTAVNDEKIGKILVRQI